MRHHGGEAAVGGRHCRQACGAAVGVEGIGLSSCAVVVHKAHGRDGLRRVTPVRKVGKTLAMRHSNGQARTGQALEEQRGRFQHLDHGQARLKTLALVGGKPRPGLGTGNDVGQFGKHLAAVANTQTKCVAAAKKGLELRSQRRI